MILSILIPSMDRRAGKLASMLGNLENQIETLGVKDVVEILVLCDAGADVGGKTTGQKRNELVAKSKGRYVVHVDDDDAIPQYYIEELLKAAGSDADCFGISGIITTDGRDEKVWHISKDLHYGASFDTQGREYYTRYPNHICPMKREIAIQIPYPDQTIGEDFAFATALHNAGLIKTEYRIERFPMYHYKFKHKPVSTQFFGQNQEDKTVSEFFGAYVGTLLEIGANDGETLSNSLYLLNAGWKGCLVEPSPKVFPNLTNLYQYNNDVHCYRVAIGDKNGPATFYDSGELLKRGDRALVSTVNPEETKRWESMKMPFDQIEVQMMTFDAFMEISAYKTFDFISLDAEGSDWLILKQMDLDKLKCRVLCIEHNGLPNLIHQYSQYVEPLGFRKLVINGENVIFCRNEIKR